MNETTSAERIHIGFFGRSNVGKSSLMNAVTNQEISVVSPVRGTTTDPVRKSMELLPLGPVVMMDTPGLDDDTELGSLRTSRARQTLNRADIALLVLDGTVGLTPEDSQILDLILTKQIPCVVAVNKSDLPGQVEVTLEGMPIVKVSARTGEGIQQLKETLASSLSTEAEKRRVIGDLLSPGDLVVLVTPIDAAAPKGRLILPQVQTLRDILDAHATAIVTQVPELEATLARLAAPPKLVVTDSQAFTEVAKRVPTTIPLTSFSILFARYKGFLKGAYEGVQTLSHLEDGARILISEGCTHHRQCGDIGTEKLPKLLLARTGKKLQFEFTSGTGFPEGDLSSYAAIIHCGGCMLTEREMRYRAKCAADQGIPFTNYGITLAYLNGILERCIAPLKL